LHVFKFSEPSFGGKRGYYPPEKGGNKAISELGLMSIFS
jgi:hypothetical protein